MVGHWKPRDKRTIARGRELNNVLDIVEMFQKRLIAYMYRPTTRSLIQLNNYHA